MLRIKTDISSRILSVINILQNSYTYVCSFQHKGGASLLAGGAFAGVNINDADDCSRNAHRHREDAANKRQQAAALRGQRDALLNQKSSLEAEIERLQNQKSKY